MLRARVPRLATGSLRLFRRGGDFAFIELFAPRIFAIFNLNDGDIETAVRSGMQNWHIGWQILSK